MSTPSTWQRLGDPIPTDLVDARLQLHWAAQLVSAVGTTLLAPAPDDSHTNLEWLAAPGLLAGRFTAPAPSYRAALRPNDLTLLVLDNRGTAIAEHRLHGRTFGQGLVWLEQEIAACTKSSLPKPLRQPDLVLPDHRVAHGAPFSTTDAAAFAEIGRWYANAAAALSTLVEPMRDAAPIRCWPHHFDLATLVTIDRRDRHGRTIGVGMSPGDTSYAEPYFYATPWPYPDNPDLPALDGGGAWHREGWTGAVLAGSSLVAAGSASDQARQVSLFLRSAVEACRALLGAGA